MRVPAPPTLLHPGMVHVPADPSEAPSLLGARCASCRLVVFPATAACPRCLSRQLTEVRIGRTARLHSHAVARVAPQGFSAPYYQAFVELPEGPRVFTLIGREVPAEPDQLVDGAEMRLVVEPLADTPEKRHLLTYKYVPADRRPRVDRDDAAVAGMATHA